MKSIQTLAVAFALSASAIAQPAQAEENGFALELNTLRSTDTGCRMTYVARNATGADIDAASFEVAVFDAEGAVNRLLILEFGALRDGRTKVVQFDLANQACDDISRLLVNTAAECSLQGDNTADCLDMLVPSSRTDVAFGL